MLGAPDGLGTGFAMALAAIPTRSLLANMNPQCQKRTDHLTSLDSEQDEWWRWIGTSRAGHWDRHRGWAFAFEGAIRAIWESSEACGCCGARFSPDSSTRSPPMFAGWRR